MTRGRPARGRRFLQWTSRRRFGRMNEKGKRKLKDGGELYFEGLKRFSKERFHGALKKRYDEEAYDDAGVYVYPKRTF